MVRTHNTNMLWIVVVWFGIACVRIHGVEAVRCFECTHYPSPSLCLDVTTCSADEDCYVEEIVTTGGRVVYNSGCFTRHRCSALNVLLQKRNSDITTCKTCCHGNLCNKEGCSKTAIPRDQRGPYCFSCPLMSKPHECDEVAICNKDQRCAIYIPPEYQSYPVPLYRARCENKDVCGLLPSGESACPATCCDTDFCNNHCDNTTTTTVTSTMAVTSTPAPTTATSTIPSTAIASTSAPKTATSTIPSTTVASTSAPTTATTSIPSTAIASTSAPTTPPTPTTPTTTHVTTTVPITHSTTTKTTKTVSTTTTSTPTTTIHRAQGICQNNFQHVPNTDLCILIGDTDHKKSWSDARADCQHAGGDLLVFKTDQERTALYSYLHSFLGTHHDDGFWIGIVDGDDTGQFEFLNGEHINYTMWAWTQPNRGNEHCVRAVYHLDLRWADHECSHKHNYICGTNVCTNNCVTTATTVKTSVPTISQGRQCRSNYQRISGTDLCIAVHEHERTWDSAREHCQHDGGDLLVYKTNDEREALVSYFHHQLDKDEGEYWLGIRDFHHHDHFEYIHGGDVTDSLWGHSQPDQGHENCVRANLGESLRWRDHTCDDKYGYMCQSELI